MAKLDFKTEEGQSKATEIAKKIFYDFDETETEFSEFGTLCVTVDGVFDFRFATADDLLQIQRLIMLLELKKLDRLASGEIANG